MNIPIGLAGLVLTLLRVGESEIPSAHRPAWPGFATLTGGMLALVYGLIRAGEAGWPDVGTITCLALAAVLLLLFTVRERRAPHPMFDLALFRVPTFAGGSIAAFCMNASLYAMYTYLVLCLQHGLHYSPLQTGVRLLVVTCASLVTATAAGRASAHLPVRWLIGPGLALTGTGLLLMTGLTGTSGWTHLIPGFVVAGLGSGMVNPPLASTAVGVVPPRQAGMASGINTTFRQVGIATSIAALGTIFTAQLPAEGYARTMNHLLLVAGITALAGSVLATLLIRTRDFRPALPAPGPADAPPPAQAAGEAQTAA